MSESQTVILSSGDYSVLQSLVVPPGEERDLLVEMVRRKLNQAIVTFPADIGADVVGIGSRVRYRIDGGAAEEGTLVDVQRPDAGFLPLLSPHGLALLGLSVGQSAVVGANEQVLAVEAVDRPQPVRNGHALAAPTQRDPRVLQFIPRSAVPAPGLAYGGDEDDPGPSAA